MTRADVVVVGGGVIGLAVARELARRGAAVAVLERGVAGSGSTRAAAGILSPTDPHEWEGDLGRFNQEAIAAWPAWAAELADETGEDPGLEERGEVRVGAAGEPFLDAARAGAAAAGWDCEELDARALSELEPEVDAADRVALHLPGTMAVHADRLVGALARACRQAGVALVEHADVVRVDEAASVVETAAGTRLAFGRVVLAAGAWSSARTEHGVRPAVRPVLGESVILRSPHRVLCHRAVRTSNGSIVPRADGTYWAGTTLLERGFQDRPSAGSVRAILARAAALVPAVDEALVVEARSGLRPVSADGRPVVGELSPALVAATGHGREGVIHAPSCARAVAAGITAGDWSGVPSSFRPSAQR